MEYILDASKWVCGYGGDYALHGKMGYETRMLNDDKFMCCLGQFASQKLKELGEDVELNMMDTSEPNDVAFNLKLVYDYSFVLEPDDPNDGGGFGNTELSIDLMNINDHPDTTPREKVKQIEAKLIEHGHTLKVINEEHLDNWKLRNE